MYHRYWDSHSSSSSPLRCGHPPCRLACTWHTSIVSHNCLVRLHTLFPSFDGNLCLCRHDPLEIAWTNVTLMTSCTSHPFLLRLTVSVRHFLLHDSCGVGASIDACLALTVWVSQHSCLFFASILYTGACFLLFTLFWWCTHVYCIRFFWFILHCFWWCTHVYVYVFFWVTQPHLIMRVYLSIGVASVMDFSSRVYRSGIL